MKRFIVLSLCFAAACGDNASAPGDPADAGVDAPLSCDPATDASCVDEKQGLFVDAAKGTDGAEGTKAAPIKTISAALGKLGSKTRIYVCDGAYPGTLAIKTSVAIYGGFACADWKAGGGKVSIVGDAEYGVDISAANVTLSDVEVQAPASTDKALSSIAVRVVGVDGVVLRRAKLVARDGANGARATLIPFTTLPSQEDLNGANASGSTGGDRPAVVCPGGKKTKGGKGGDNGFGGDDGEPSPVGGRAGTIASCGTGGTGFDGMPGLGGAAGDSPTGPGRVNDAKWTPSSGADGEVGGPGGGGGGGVGLGGGGGGQGGAGGCGGAGGGGGGGGGASIALLAVNAGVTIRNSNLLSASGGDGGDGTTGQAGQTTFGFSGNRTAVGCNGGNGGTGGQGGGGAGGAGGLSAGVVYVGKAPVVADTTITNGAPGGAGKGAASNDGIPGDAKDVYEAK